MDEGTVDVTKKTLEEVVRRLSSEMSTIVLGELERAIKQQNLNLDSKKEIVPYLAAAGSLAFAGKDIDREGIARLLEAADIEVDEDLMDQTSSLHYKNHLIYVCALYFIIGIGHKPTTQELMAVIKAYGAHPDAKMSQFVIDTYNSSLPKV